MVVDTVLDGKYTMFIEDFSHGGTYYRIEFALDNFANGIEYVRVHDMFGQEVVAKAYSRKQIDEWMKGNSDFHDYESNEALIDAIMMKFINDGEDNE